MTPPKTQPTTLQEPSAFMSQHTGYVVLPFRYTRIPNLPEQVLVTTSVGEYFFLSESEFAEMNAHRLSRDSATFRALLTRQIICDAERGPNITGLEAQQHTRKLFAGHDPALHIFVVTLRCDHRCHYCQVSPRQELETGFDMTEATAEAALDRVFESQAPILTIEFQGGESVLAFERVRWIVKRAIERKEGKSLRFVITSTLHLMTEEMLQFCRDNDIELSTSLDGPAHVHNSNRINATRNSFELTVEGIARARDICGHDRVAALATITRSSLPYAREIIDIYVDLGFTSISLRPLSPFGFAVRSQRKLGYTMDEFLTFYREGLDYLISLNLAGIQIEESYATLLLTRILTPFPTPYVDLQSPSAAGSGVLVYNYDGGVYVSDEGRMLAEMGDDRFRMGSVHEPMSVLQKSSAMEIIRQYGDAERLPVCKECAFVPYCGADPVFHVATQGHPAGHRPTSEFCERHTDLFRLIFEYLSKNDANTMRVFLSWIARRPTSEILHPGYLT